MSTYVITGATDGMGKGVAAACLRDGHQVIAIGNTAEKIEALRREAAEQEASGRLDVIRADLSLVAENQRVANEIADRYPVVDALVLAARHYRSTRHQTAEGIESNFALFYLSRFLLSRGLSGVLAAAHRPVILDLAGPGEDLSRIRWEDLQFIDGYDAGQVMSQCGKLSDLNGVSFVADHADSGICYVLLHPGLTATGFSGNYSRHDARVVARMRERGQPVEVAVSRIRRHLDSPHRESLVAYMQDEKVDTGSEAFSSSDAQRLKRVAVDLLASVANADSGRA